MRMGAEIYQNLKSVVKKKYGIDGIFYKLLLLLFSSITFSEKRDSSTCVGGIFFIFFIFMRNIMIKCAGCKHKKEFLSFKSKIS